MDKEHITIGVCGPSGSGKSEVCAALKSRGFAVVDVDKLAKSLYKKGKSGYTRLVRVFGTGILGRGGHIDRRKLAELVFHDPKNLEKINRSLFPLIIKSIRETIISKHRIGRRKICLDMAVLLEARADRLADEVWFVTDTRARREARLRRRGLNPRRARAQAAALKVTPVQRRRVTRTLINRDSLAALRLRVDRAVKELGQI